MSLSRLPSGFVFSQASLQDYTSCARRFQLRYILQVRWPQADDEPATQRERRLQQGAAFHYLVHQHALGIPNELLDPIAGQDTILRRWWQAYLHTPPRNLPSTLYRTELRLSMPLSTLSSHHHPAFNHNYQLTARYDLLAIAPGQRAVIVDWKTGTNRPKRIWLEKQWQTLIYRYVLVYAGTHLNNHVPFQPEQIEMVYWFADFPAQSEHFGYTTEQHNATAQALAKVTAEIEARQEPEWPLTNDERQCRYCTFRALCNRYESQSQGGQVPEEPETDSFDFELELEQIAEIVF